MTFYVFQTQEEAEAAESQIVENIKSWVQENRPEAVTEDGRLRGRNAKTGELVDVFTTRWATPALTATGVWVFAKPTQDRTSPIPVDKVLQGISATESEQDREWFPEPDLD
jgi:hypothetical protein